MRAHNAAVREAQRFAREQERAMAAARRASAAERAAAEKAAAAAHVAARQAEVQERNARLAATYDEIDNLLAATLDVDDWVDLESLRESVEDRPLDRPDLRAQTPRPHYHALPAPPVYVAPAPPSGLGSAFGGSRRHATQLENARRAYLDLFQRWQQALTYTFGLNAELRAGWRQREATRLTELRDARSEHDRDLAECRARAAESNARLDNLIAGLRARKPEAMDEYVGIVLANSVYPEVFEVSYEHSFDAADRELHITVLAPHPDTFPTTKEFRYRKTTDEITETAMPATEVRRRYASAIAQTTLRTAHEIFEADREEVIDSIALTVAVDTVDSATGHATRVDLVRLATDRADFLPINLAHVTPADTLNHLSAAVSKNPYGLVPLANQGVRG